MSIPIATASPWPARAAYFAAVIFSTASGATNLAYGWAKGTDLVSSLVWAAVAGSVAIIFALSWPALIKSIDAKRWSAAIMALVALVLSGSYSVTAALGSAAGGRMNAATAETDNANTRAKAQSAYDMAKAELAAMLAPAHAQTGLIEAGQAELARLPTTRSVAEIQALIDNASRNPRGAHGCTARNGSLAMSCPKLETEKARAQRRAELTRQIAEWNAEVAQANRGHAEQRDRLKAAMDAASAALAHNGSVKVANSDSKALGRYLAALGVEIGTTC